MVNKLKLLLLVTGRQERLTLKLAVQIAVDYFKVTSVRQAHQNAQGEMTPVRHTTSVWDVLCFQT
eukprot:SAG11_NODE_38668_length_251_cov_0.684211_1_plen_64_part_10